MIFGGWGSGFVVNLSKIYKKPEDEYRKWSRFKQYTLGSQSIPFKLGQVQPVPVNKFTLVINMIGQHETIVTNSKPIRYAALASCMNKSAQVARQVNGEFHCPWFGCRIGFWQT